MNHELRLRLPHKPVIHDRTVARALEGMLYRVKWARPLPADRNRSDVLQKRVEYGNWFIGHAVVNHTRLYLARKKCDCGIGNFTH